MISYNKFIVEPYKTDRSLRAEVKSGFATISQKVKVIGLKLLCDAQITTNNSYNTLPKGATIYVREEVLHNQQFAKTLLESDGIEGQFMIVDASYMEFADPIAK